MQLVYVHLELMISMHELIYMSASYFNLRTRMLVFVSLSCMACTNSMLHCSAAVPPVTAPFLRVPEEGTLGAEKHLEVHLDKLLEGGGVKVTPLVGFQLLSHPHSHWGV
jgi:hypothetical protein